MGQARWVGCIALLLVCQPVFGKPNSAPSNALSIDGLLANMSLHDKVGQLLMVGFAGTELDDKVVHWVHERRVGGVVLFSRNIVNLAQTVRLNQALQAQSAGGVPLFIALDQEGGNVLRMRSGVMTLPGNMALGATRAPLLAYLAGQASGLDLRLIGFNMNLAPVLDINSNPQNPVIGVRSYGEKPALVASLGTWFIRGQQEAGLVAVAKHFPGHGDTQVDSHLAMPSIDVPLTHLQNVELLPFKEAIHSGLDALMTAHIALPKIAEAPYLPATLSRRILTDLLRQQLGFEGIILTDGLEMQAIVQRYGSGRAAVMAIVAGADMAMVLWSAAATEQVYQALYNAVLQGEISHDQLDQAVRRIVRVKLRRHLFTSRAESWRTILDHSLHNDVHTQIAEQIARQAVTYVRVDASLLPLRPQLGQRLVVLAPPGAFGTRLAREPGVEVVTAPLVPSRTQRRALVAQLGTLLAQSNAWVGAVINRHHLDIVAQASQANPNVPLLLLSFASPYYLKDIPSAKAYVCTYSYLDAAQRAAAEAILGHYIPSGRLPVTLPDLAAYGEPFAAPETPTATPPTVPAT